MKTQKAPLFLLGMAFATGPALAQSLGWLRKSFLREGTRDVLRWKQTEV